MKGTLPTRPACYAAAAAGACASQWLTVSPWLCALALPLFALTLRRGARAWILLCLLAIMGLGVGVLRLPSEPPDPLAARVAASGGPSFVWMRGRVESSEPWMDGCRADLHVRSYLEGSAWTPCATRVRSYLPIRPPLDGSPLEACLRLALPEGRDNPGQFDMAAFLRREGFALTGTARAPGLIRIGAPARWTPVARYRHALESRLMEDTGESGGALLAILLGERGLMTPAQVDALSASGLYHLVALSGFNVGLLLIALATMAHLFRVHPGARDMASLALLLAYGALVASQPSLARALLMATLFLLARWLARPQGGLTAWSASLAVLLLWNPRWALDAGFQLTFAATLGILLLWDALPPAWTPPTLWGHLVRLHWIGLAAQVATLPLVALAFHRVSLLGWLATPLASLPLAAVQALGTAYLFGLAWVPGVHSVIGVALDGLTRAFLWLPTWLGEGRRGTLFVPQPHWIWVALYALAFAMLCGGRRTRRAGWFLAGLAVVGAWAWPRTFPARVEPSLVVLDVGQASCQVLRWGGHALLVDAGNGAYRGATSGRTVVEPFLAATGIGYLDGILLTHWDTDHSGSILDMVADLPVGFLAYPATDPPDRGAPGTIAEACRRRGVHLHPLARGNSLDLEGLSMAVLNPPAAEALPDENDRSLVLSTRLGATSILFTGDLKGAGESALVAAGLLSPTKVLVVPHHGSGTSSTPPFLEALRPRLALMSVGRGNRFGHPAPTTILRLRGLGARIARTDRDGALLLSGLDRHPELWRLRDGDWAEWASRKH